jgi:hypothetical protein
MKKMQNLTGCPTVSSLLRPMFLHSQRLTHSPTHPLTHPSASSGSVLGQEKNVHQISSLITPSNFPKSTQQDLSVRGKNSCSLVIAPINPIRASTSYLGSSFKVDPESERSASSRSRRQLFHAWLQEPTGSRHRANQQSIWQPVQARPSSQTSLQRVLPLPEQVPVPTMPTSAHQCPIGIVVPVPPLHAYTCCRHYRHPGLLHSRHASPNPNLPSSIISTIRLCNLVVDDTIQYNTIQYNTSTATRGIL